MYTLDPTAVITLARQRVEAELARAEAAREAKRKRIARRAERRAAAAAPHVRRRRFATVVRQATPGFGF